ncbi:MAG: decarboxylase [Chloroflexi bacterium]|nr:decarboxylase [Chloroflexota bacterium]
MPAMTWYETTFECLKQQDIRSVVYVPDTIIGDLIRLTEADHSFDVVGLTREEEGVGILCGAHLGGRRGVLMMQNSGLGNAANALASLAMPYQVPFLMLISQRGELGEFNTVQVGMGQALRPILDSLGIPHFTLERQDEIAPVLTGASKLAFSTDRPVAIVLSPLLTGGKQG